MISRCAALLAVLLLVSGCETLTATTSEAQCAGREPITYNSRNPKSQFYAAPKLAPQIAVANQTGVNLRCEKFQ